MLPCSVPPPKNIKLVSTSDLSMCVSGAAIFTHEVPMGGGSRYLLTHNYGVITTDNSFKLTLNLTGEATG